MIIPKFRLSQDNQYIIIIIRVPYVKIQSSEFFIEEYQFKFFLHPYFLTLNFKQNLKTQEDPDHVIYDHTTYELTVKLHKQNEGEFFEDLDMLTKLINKPEKNKKQKKQIKNKVQIEVLNEKGCIEELKEEFDKLKIQPDKSYGFNDQFQNFFTDLEEEIIEIGEINPDTVDVQNRIQMRNEIIIEKFDPDRYLFDLFDNDQEIEQKIQYQLNIIQIASQNSNKETNIIYTEQEHDLLVRLPNKQYLIGDKNKFFRQIVDIIYAYLYELRVMEDDLTSESAQTINRISSLLSCFAIDQDLFQVVRQCYVRSLVYPLYRNFLISQRVFEDLLILFSSNQSKIYILKCFLQIYNLFEISEPRYLLNRLYIEDYCIFIQYLQDDDFMNIYKQLELIKINKENLCFGILELEKEALEIIKLEENDQKL